MIVSEVMTKSHLLETLRAKRAEFDAALAQVPQEQMIIGGVQGDWSVKDIIAHLTYYEGWMADRLHEQLRGESYTPNEWDMMHFDDRNILIYGKFKDRPLPEVLSESRRVFNRLVAGVEAHTEAFLTEPQQFEGAPQPVIVWQMLASEVYDHYGQHIPYITEWLASNP